MSKEKKCIFSEEIDSSISGFSLGVAFVVDALFVWFGGLLHNRICEMVAVIILLLIGICGTFLEIEKANRDSIKGFDDLGLGISFSMLSIFLIIKYDILFWNIVCMIVLLFSVYATFSGILKIGYSLKIQKRKTGNKKVEIFKIITGITEIIALVVVILQLAAELM